MLGAALSMAYNATSALSGCVSIMILHFYWTVGRARGAGDPLHVEACLNWSTGRIPVGLTVPYPSSKVTKLPENLRGDLGLFELGDYVESPNAMLRGWISEVDVRVLTMSTDHGLNPTIVQYNTLVLNAVCEIPYEIFVAMSAKGHVGWPLSALGHVQGIICVWEGGKSGAVSLRSGSGLARVPLF